ncbi:M20/M25/M40 family metallo-hydrolase [Pseudoduganella namucuonensis]|uniref:Glutamate carboxypeptidase n=1 Tax=Pseudoduganella namucuonensis TaxID=1035707 RepID=A0A1I7JML8_9BURK|nr:M20/M25/M40 family metallo-hydrolase [Pseudoduganella namucuonensis]SFU86406.1 glutamate carboxypeptidase [Pseudoduganella namucuonensis]
MKRQLLGALAACAMQAASAAGLTATEQSIVAAVKANADKGLALLERSVNINSGTMNHEGVRAVGKLFRAEFDALGFQTRWIDMPPAVQRAGHLVAERGGKQGKRLLLIGHLDTVFEKDSPVRLWNRNGNTVRGQGVNDMKGGDVIIIEALRALHSVGALDNTTITVMFTGDEENAGEPKDISRGDMVAAAKRSDIALAFEATALDAKGQATGTIGRRASSSWELDVKGKQGHSSAIFREQAGYGAIYEAARILDGFRQQVVEPDLTFSPGLILGGTGVTHDDAGARGTAHGKTNVIPNTAMVKGDMRYLSYEQRDRARAKMRAIVAQSLPGTSASISFHDSYPPMSPTAGNLKVLEVYSKASEDAGYGPIAPLPPGLRGAGDVQFVAPYVDSLDGLGATGNGAHSPDEDLDISSIERATIRTAILLYRLTR